MSRATKLTPEILDQMIEECMGIKKDKIDLTEGLVTKEKLTKQKLFELIKEVIRERKENSMLLVTPPPSSTDTPTT